MSETPKRIKKLIREFAAIAHNRELSRALQELHSDFDRWEKGEISALQLNGQIHEFHQGPSREIWVKYSTHDGEAGLAAAVVTGVIRKEEVPDDLLKHLEPLIEFYEGHLNI